MISVIMCSHNPRPEYIARSLDSLASQTLPFDRWELIVVDNASDERLDKRLDLSFQPSSRVIRENELGLTPARLSGMRESIGSVLVFVDDDNVLAPDYLERVADIAESHSFLGAWSGSVSPEFEAPPAEWTRRYWGNLVIREVKRDAWSNIPGIDETTPLGAGLCVRRNVALEYLRLHDEGLRWLRLDRAGGSLVSGGDNDLAECATDVGMACGVMSSLHVTHLIPKERLTEDYLLRLIEGIAYSGVLLRSFRPGISNGAGPRGIVGSAADALRRLRMTPRERRFDSAVRRGRARAHRELESA